MTVLRDLWEKYKKLELINATRTAKVLEAEALIHEEQKRMGVSAYDFEARLERRDKMAKSTVEGPPAMDSTSPSDFVVPQSRFTLEQAKEIIGENEFSLLEDCAKLSEARMICLASILDKLNPTENKNVARRGQGINMTITEYHKRKEKK